jgi:proteasome lid subunit RPN8/RPN11
MTFSTPTTTRASKAKPRLRCAAALWRALCAELRRRSGGYRECGAFLLGRLEPDGRRIEQVVFYDDIAPGCLSTGICILPGSAFGVLWARCRAAGLEVVADVHTHPFGAGQSRTDRMNPMVAVRGHLALIVPDFAQGAVTPEVPGIYEYLGSHRWRSHRGTKAALVLSIEVETT